MAKLNIAELDFENIKINLKNYLKNQTQFKDYNFEGSNMAVLLDVLAYNTFQNNFYTNMAINEMFLDSAILKNSVMSHAKELNYLPRSRRSPRAVVTVTITDFTIGGQTITLPAYTLFTTNYQGVAYDFVTDKAYVARKVAAGTFVAENIEIFEGQMLASFEREGYYIDGDGVLRVILTNENADTDSIAVFVDAEASDDENVFIRKNDIFGVGPTDKVFYVEPYYDGRYSIYFGNNVFGAQPDEYQDIRVRYRITSGPEANGAFAFSTQPTLASSTINVTTIQPAAGGSERETLESIRYMAPKSLQIQERAITSKDYEILLQQQFPEIQAVAAYGGEELSPPQFGKVAISVYLGEGREGLSNTLAAAYIDYLSDKSPLGVEPIFIPSEFMYACLMINVKFDPKLSKLSASQIEVLVREKVQEYYLANLDNFNTTLRNSNLVSIIDNSDASIVSSRISADPFFVYSPAVEISASPSFQFNTELVKPYPFKDSNGFTDYKPSFKSSIFDYNYVPCYMQDDGIGNVQIVTSDAANPQVIVPKAGTVNYTTGEINLINFKTTGYPGAGIRILVVTKDNDVKAPRGRIFVINDEDVTVTISEVK